jgi:peptidoglycan/xylan/chitin deacetylase (PgdA/CDA1 family)
MRPDPLTRLLAQGGATGHGPVALMYHSVAAGAGSPVWPWAVSLQRFRDQLDWLVDAGYSTPTVQEVVAGTASQAPRTALITFDDGYVDNLAAIDELQRRGLRATWFVVAGSIGQAPAWTNDGRPPGRLLSATELRSIRSAGMEIGSHTTSHCRLPDLDDDALAFELHRSRAALQDILGTPVLGFAYPYGESDARCESAVRQAGYGYALTTRTGWALRDGDAYRMRRLTIFNHDTVGSFARKLVFGSHDVSWPYLARYWTTRAWHAARGGA